jgi:hypothetical protein
MSKRDKGKGQLVGESEEIVDIVTEAMKRSKCKENSDSVNTDLLVQKQSRLVSIKQRCLIIAQGANGFTQSGTG